MKTKIKRRHTKVARLGGAFTRSKEKDILSAVKFVQNAVRCENYFGAHGLSTKILEDVVVRMCKFGWTPQGGVFVNAQYFYQAMVCYGVKK